jgi:uncharacterized membrane protein YhaH (DUF805 family)
MNIFKSIQSSLARYFVFTGRSTRSDFWYFLLFNSILLFGAYGLDDSFDHLNTLIYISDYFYSGLSLVVVVLFFIPSLTLSVRRLRDIGESGWWMLLFYPFFNDFFIIYDFVNVYNAKFIIFSFVILVWSIWWLGFRKSL